MHNYLKFLTRFLPPHPLITLPHHYSASPTLMEVHFLKNVFLRRKWASLPMLRVTFPSHLRCTEALHSAKGHHIIVLFIPCTKYVWNSFSGLHRPLFCLLTRRRRRRQLGRRIYCRPDSAYWLSSKSYCMVPLSKTWKWGYLAWPEKYLCYITTNLSGGKAGHSGGRRINDRVERTRAYCIYFCCTKWTCMPNVCLTDCVDWSCVDSRNAGCEDEFSWI